MKYQFTIDCTESMDSLTTSLMLYASAVFAEAYQDEWEQAMAMLAEKIGQQVRSQLPDEAPALRLVPEDGG
jgi:hypothetical protein